MTLTINKNNNITSPQRKRLSEPNTPAPKHHSAKDSLLVGALFALATLAYPAVETKSQNNSFEYNTETYNNITNNFHQGSDIGNCVGVATLKAFTQSKEGADYLNSLVKKDKNNNFVVSFPNKNPITIQQNIISKYEAIVGNDYAEAITFALYKDAGNLDDNGIMKQGKNTNPAQISLNERSTFQRLTGLEPNCSSGSLKDLRKINDYLQSGKKLLMTTAFNDGVQECTNYQIFPFHEFTITDVNLKKNSIKVANPWFQDESKIIDISVDDFQKYNSGINILLMNTDKEHITFSNPDIGLKPGEIDYEFYFDIINYQPTKEDYQKYFNKNKYQKGENNEFTLSFWSNFDEKGFEYYLDKKNKQLSTNEITDKMKNYTDLRKEGYTPIALVKQYLTKKTIPEFKTKNLQNKKPEIKNWLETFSNNITYEIQIEHYSDLQKQIEKQKQEELLAKKKIEEELKRIKEQEKIEQLKLYNDSVLSNLKEGIFKYPKIEGAKFPNDLNEYKTYYPGCRVMTNSKGQKFIRTSGFSQNEIEVITFDKNGHILSNIMKNKNGEIKYSEKYEYNNDGSRICTKKGVYGNLITQEVFNKNGELIVLNSFNKENKYAVRKTYITAPNGKSLEKSYIKQMVFGTKYTIETLFEYENDYEFNNDGSVKKEHRKIIETRNGEKHHTETETIEYCKDNIIKYYWNNELKAIRKNDILFDMKGNQLKSFILKDLPSAKEE